MSDNKRSLRFAAILCLVCSLLLTAAAAGLKGRQDRNVAIDKQKNILKSVGLVEADQKYTAQAVEGMFKEKIRCVWVGPAGKIFHEPMEGKNDLLAIYLYVEKKEIEAYIVPVDSKGLWGKIFGYLAIDKDGSTIAGFTVYSHQETPGLGGEIEQAWFQKNFVGKKIVDRESRFVSVSIAKGAAEEAASGEKLDNYVDGISGATLTGRFLSEGIYDILAKYEPISVRFRENRVNALPNKR